MTRANTPSGPWGAKPESRQGWAVNALTLAEALRGFRLMRGLSARSVSKLAGLSDSYVAKLEAGSLDPSARSFAAISLALRLESNELLFCVKCMIAERRSCLDTEQESV